MQVIDHKTITGNLTPEQRNWLLARSDFAGLRQLSVHLAAIAICTGLILFEVHFFGLVLVLQGILIVFLFTPLHETVHQTPFRSKSLNLWVGRFCGFLVFLAPEWFRFFHLAHHRYTHQPEKDPELSTPKPVTWWQYLKYLSGFPDITNRIRTLIRNAVTTNRDEFVPARGKSKVCREARIQLALYIGLFGLSIMANSTVLISIWILPILLGGPFLRGYLLAEHARCPHVSSMLENTRTTFTNAFVRFIAWNMPYHVEHHAYPSVPFHKLPEFHAHINAYIMHKQDGYLRFNRNYLVDSWAQKLEQ
jgi:fatty acid desaturase